MSDGLIFFLCLLDCGGLLGLNVYFLILLSDLECDYINASNACKKLNNFVMVSFQFLKIFKADVEFLARNRRAYDRNVFLSPKFSLDPFCSEPAATYFHNKQADFSSTW